MGKKIGVSALLIVLIGISIYMWKTQAVDESDAKIDKAVQDWKCNQCEGEFKLTIAESRDMFQAGNDGVICPLCEAAGAQKQDVQVVVGGFGGLGDSDEEDEEEEEEEDAQTVGGRVKRGE